MTELEAKEAFERLEDAEHASRHGGFTKRAAVLVAVLAGLLAVATLLSNRSSQQTILRQTEAFDAYNEFEANSLKAHVDSGNASVLRTLGAGTENAAAAGAQADALEKGIEQKYDPNKARLLAKAQDLERQRDAEENRHTGLQVSEGAFEIAIVLTSVALLTGLAALLWTSAGLGVVGLVILVVSLTLG